MERAASASCQCPCMELSGDAWGTPPRGGCICGGGDGDIGARLAVKGTLYRLLGWPEGAERPLEESAWGDLRGLALRPGGANIWLLGKPSEDREESGNKFGSGLEVSLWFQPGTGGQVAVGMRDLSIACSQASL